MKKMTQSEENAASTANVKHVREGMKEKLTYLSPETKSQPLVTAKAFIYFGAKTEAQKKLPSVILNPEEKLVALRDIEPGREANL
jgi:hypothetical protein